MLQKPGISKKSNREQNASKTWNQLKIKKKIVRTTFYGKQKKINTEISCKIKKYRIIFERNSSLFSKRQIYLIQHIFTFF
jgi:hypothetical protein